MIGNAVMDSQRHDEPEVTAGARVVETVLPDWMERALSALEVNDPLRVLLKSGDIEPPVAGAALGWRRDWVRGVIGAADPEAKSSGRKTDHHDRALARLDAVSRCRRVRDALGLVGETRLRLFLVDSMSYSTMAAVLMPGDVNGRKKIAAQMVLLLQQLGELDARFSDEASQAHTVVFGARRSGKAANQDATRHNQTLSRVAEAGQIARECGGPPPRGMVAAGARDRLAVPA